MGWSLMVTGYYWPVLNTIHFTLCSLQTGPEGGNQFCTRDRILIDLLSPIARTDMLEIDKVSRS